MRYNEIRTRKHGEVARLANNFKVARSTVSRALSGEARTVLTQNIRKAAISNGGIEIKHE